MSKPLAFWQEKYPQAFCWSFGDSPEMADELASLVIAGKKRATCGSFASYQAEERPVRYILCLTARAKQSASYARCRYASSALMK